MKKPFDNCPICNTILEQKKKPRSLDLTVCGFCATMLKFNSEIKLTTLSTADFLALDQHTQDGLNEIVYTIVNKRK